MRIGIAVGLSRKVQQTAANAILEVSPATAHAAALDPLQFEELLNKLSMLVNVPKKIRKEVITNES